MKALIILLIGLSAFRTFAQNLQTVDLRWKIGKNEKLNYSTAMVDIDTSTIEINFDGLFKALADSSKSALNESKDIFKKINEALKKYDYITTLSNKGNGVVDIVMAIKPKEPAKDAKTDTSESKEAGLLKLMQSINKGIMLRGSVYETGGIHSFWVKSNQKNLIALFFELPARPVKIGDKWPLYIDLIANDQNFDCDSSYKLNEVTLTDIKKVNNETIAVLKYNIVEYVKGDFNVSSFVNGNDAHKKTIMEFIFQGIAEFSIDHGRWLTYDAIMSLEASGAMTAKNKTKFTLTKAGK